MLATAVEQTTTTVGTGTYNLTAPTDPLRISFVTGIGSGNPVWYRCELGSSWEEGWGVITAGTPDVLTRNIVRSSNANAAVSWPAGTKRIYCSGLSEALRFGNKPLPTATGTANARAIAHFPPCRALIAGMEFQFINGSGANTGAATLAVDSLGALNVLMPDGSALPPGALVGSLVTTVIYDGTGFRLSAQGLSAWQTLPGGRVSASAASTIDFTLPTGFKAFRLSFWSTTLSASTTLNLRCGVGASFDAGGSDYNYGYTAEDNTTVTRAQSVGSTIQLTNVVLSAQPGHHGQIHFTPGTGTEQFQARGDSAEYSSGSYEQAFRVQGRRNTAAAKTSIRLYPGSGTVTGEFLLEGTI